MEPPSQLLQQLLDECGVCGPRELRRCRGRVRRLARDLPAFDSVWIDALLQSRILTGYQARLLSSNDPRRLRVGPCVLLDRLGGGQWSETCVAEIIGRRGVRRALKRLVVPSDVLEAVSGRLQTLTVVGKRVAHPGVVVPEVVMRAGPEIVVGSRYIDGPSLRDLLVRRGRFPSAVVDEIGAGLVEGLCELEANGVVHGDLRTANVRLSADGVAVAVDAGVAPAVEPTLVVDVNRNPDRYDGVSPERVAASSVSTQASDMYALGCMLFELLAGRPPFPVAEPVMKLNAHQQLRVADVREWAPDVPDHLAERVRQLCAHDPAERPESWKAIGASWRRGGRPRYGRDFVRQMRSAAPGGSQPVPRKRLRAVMGIGGTVVALVLAAVVWSGHRQPATEGSQKPLRPALAVAGVTGAGRDEVSAEAGGAPAWPVRAAGGAIRLDDSRKWPGVRLEHSSSLVITGRENGGVSRAEIRIETGRPLELRAPAVSLQGLRLRGPAGEPWVVVQGGVVRIVDCEFLGEGTGRDVGSATAVEVHDPAEQGGVYVSLGQVLMRHVATGLRVHADQAEVTAVDALQIGGARLFEWRRPSQSAGGAMRLAMRHCTLRHTRGLLCWMGGALRVEADACVLAIRSGEVLCDGRDGSGEPVVIRGRQTLLTPGATVTRGAGDVEGVVAAVPTFRGPATIDSRDSRLSRIPAGVPGVGTTRPGIRVHGARSEGVAPRPE